MAYEFWGQTPETTTVSASPTPTTTAFTVGDATNLLEEQWVLVQVDGDFERVQITDKTGNALTVNPPLSDSPDIPGEVRSGRQLIKNSLLNSGYVGNATVADLESADMSTAPAGIKAFVPTFGIYRWAPGDESFPDGESIIENADGRWLADSGLIGTGLDDALFDWFADFYGDYPAALPADLAAINAEIDAIQAAAATDSAKIGTLQQTFFVTANLDFPSITNGASQTLTATVTGVLLANKNVISLGLPSSLNDGLLPTWWVSADNTVSIRLRNVTGGSINPAAADYQIEVRVYA